MLSRSQGGEFHHLRPYRALNAVVLTDLRVMKIFKWQTKLVTRGAHFQSKTERNKEVTTVREHWLFRGSKGVVIVKWHLEGALLGWLTVLFLDLCSS